jgi:multiple sugar transport system permease protein
MGEAIEGLQERVPIPLRWLLVAPAGLLLAFVTLIPIAYLIYLSFTDFSILKGFVEGVVGFENYRNMVLNSSEFHMALLRTGLFILVVVVVQSVFGFLLALLLWGRPTRRKYVLPVLLMPMFVSWVAVGLMFRFMFEDGIGIVPLALSQIGVNISWFSNSTYALTAIMIADIWEWIPFMLILFLAGLESLPEEPIEAALVDGATRLEVLWDLILPMMKPVFAVAVFIRVVEASKVFPKVLAMTEGGPGSATETGSWIVYKIGFRFNDLGPAASQAMTLTLMVLGLLWVLYWSGGLQKDVF